jgi:hypothetical protein
MLAASDAPAEQAPEQAPSLRLTPNEIAEAELEAWDLMSEPYISNVLMPGSDRKGNIVQPLKLDDYWLDKLLRKNALVYLPRAALAAHGRMASGGATERFFRAVAFVNSASRGNQDPPTIRRLSFLQRNPEFMPTAEDLFVWYKKQLRTRKAAAQEAAEVAQSKRARTEAADSGTVDDDDMADALDGIDDDDDAPPRQDVVKGFEEFLAGLDEDMAMAWAGVGQGGGASVADAIDMDLDLAAAAAAPAITTPTTTPAHQHGTRGARGAAPAAK